MEKTETVTEKIKHPEEVEKAKPIEKEKTLLIWQGPERPFKAKDRKFYTSMISIVLVLFLFLAFAGLYILIIVFLSLLFVSYALYSIPPKNITYALSDVGVDINGEKRAWSEFTSYYISKNLDQTVINLVLSGNRLMSLSYLIPDSTQTLDEAQKIVEKYLPLKTVTIDRSYIGKAFKKLGNYIKE